MTTTRAMLLFAMICLTVSAGCAPSVASPMSSSAGASAAAPSEGASPTTTRSDDLVIVGRVVTMHEPRLGSPPDRGRGRGRCGHQGRGAGPCR